jgi:hypothetical protein
MLFGARCPFLVLRLMESRRGRGGRGTRGEIERSAWLGLWLDEGAGWLLDVSRERGGVKREWLVSACCETDNEDEVADKSEMLKREKRRRRTN